jgi:hypothetical protein
LPGGCSGPRHNGNVDQTEIITDARQRRVGPGQTGADPELVDIAETLVRLQLTTRYPQTLDSEAISESPDGVIAIKRAHRESIAIGSNEVEWGED